MQVELENLIKDRESLIKERDAIHLKITALHDSVKDQFFKELIELGIFNAFWKYFEDIDSYSYRKEVLFLTDSKLVDKACELAKKYKYDALYMDNWHFTFRHGYGPGSNSLQLSFANKYNPSEFIKKYNIKVDFSWLDEKIKELENKKRLFNE